MKHTWQKLRDVKRCFIARRTYSPLDFTHPAYIDHLRRFNGSENYRSDVDRVIELVRPRAGMKLLDFGCGLGASSAAFAARGCIVTGMDASSAMLAMASQEHPEVTFAGTGGGVHEQDAAIALHVLAFLPDLREALDAMYRALRFGGRIVLCEPNPAYTLAMLPANLFNDYLPDETSIRFRSARALRSALRNQGFKHIRFETHGEFPRLFHLNALRSRIILTARK